MSVRVRVGGAVSGAGPRSADDGVTRGESPDTIITDTRARGERRRRDHHHENTKCGAGESRGDWDKSCDSDIEATCPAHCLSLID